MQGGNLIKKSGGDKLGMRQKTNSASDYWAQKKAAKTGATTGTDYWAQKKANLAHGPGSANPAALKSTDEFDPCPNGRLPMHVVSMSNRYDRWDRMAVRWNGMMIVHPEVCLDMNRFDATNGAKDPIPLKLVTKDWSTARNRQYVGNGTWYDKVDETLELTAGERGCAASHIRLWKKAAKLNKPVILVEDDAVPVRDFSVKLKKALDEVPSDADLLYLGYSRPEKAPWREDVGESLAKVDYVWTTIGYIVWPKGARKLLQRLPVDSPVDNFMSWASHTNHTKVYAMKTPAIKTELPWNFASNVEHSDERNQKKNNRESMMEQISLFSRPFKQAQVQFTDAMDSAITGLGEDTTSSDTVLLSAPEKIVKDSVKAVAKEVKSDVNIVAKPKALQSLINAVQEINAPLSPEQKARLEKQQEAEQAKAKEQKQSLLRAK